jgi:hypothetical protein
LGVKNIGSGEANGFQNDIMVGIYLSADTELDENDSGIGGMLIATPISSEETKLIDFSDAYFFYIPTDIQVGDYYLLAIVDDFDEVTESDETNNIISNPITINLEAPIIINGGGGLEAFDIYGSNSYCKHKAFLHFTSSDPELELTGASYDFNYSNNTTVDTGSPPSMNLCYPDDASNLFNGFFSPWENVIDIYYDELVSGVTGWVSLSLDVVSGPNPVPYGDDMSGTRLRLFFHKPDGLYAVIDETFDSVIGANVYTSFDFPIK